MLLEIVGVLRTVAALPLVLFLPGYALTVALVPPRSGDDAPAEAGPDRTFTALERLCWSLGLSMGLSVLGAFALNLAPSGITPVSWMLFLGGSTLFFAAIAGARRPAPHRGYGMTGLVVATARLTDRFRRRVRLRPGQRVLFGGAALLVVLAMGVARVSAEREPSPGFTQLYLVPQAFGPAAVATWAILGVHSYELDDQQFELVLHRDGVPVDRWSFRLTPDDVSDRRVDLPTGHVIEADLYRAGDQTVYRHVSVRTKP